MKRKVVGFRLHFQSKKGNTGSLLFVEYEQDSVTGACTETIYVPDSVKIPDIKLGSIIRVFYNSSGFLEEITLA